MCRSVPEIHKHVAGTLSNQPTNKQTPFLTSVCFISSSDSFVYLLSSPLSALFPLPTCSSVSFLLLSLLYFLFRLVRLSPFFSSHCFISSSDLFVCLLSSPLTALFPLPTCSSVSFLLLSLLYFLFRLVRLSPFFSSHCFISSSDLFVCLLSSPLTALFPLPTCSSVSFLLLSLLYFLFRLVRLFMFPRGFLVFFEIKDTARKDVKPQRSIIQPSL